jgi:protein-L-isoaspartate(D-aspartate) O-methyltransferase
MEALLITRVGDNEWLKESLFETDIPALIGAPTISEFKL